MKQWKEELQTAQDLAQKENFGGRLIGAEEGKEALILYFQGSAKRGDKGSRRALEEKLQKTLHLPARLEQAKGQEKARMVGGIGPCGRIACCLFMPDLPCCLVSGKCSIQEGGKVKEVKEKKEKPTSQEEGEKKPKRKIRKLVTK